ncbi:MAG: tRNA (N6-isopentenyl adenosine(37)-C2)-methylthiotransferase MiaB [Candidatus Eisenbacteria bacterium]|nr:tRNA (N6-isopentenyl adenosine(37)-C2)-methylthiotransferase MiaB [Candidatus Eisenbacteria bacterium]
MRNDATFFIKTFGCQMNVWDSENIRDLLLSHSLSEVSRPEEADMIFVNTCSVRDHAEKRALGWIRELDATKKRNDGLIVGAMGCFAQRLGRDILSVLPNVDFVIGTDAYERFDAILERLKAGERQIIDTGPEKGFRSSPRPGRKRLRAFVSIMKGCENFCSYCVVPYVRGRERSRPLADIIEEAECLVEHGTKDITLLGQNVNSYRFGELDFAGLLNEISRITGLLRLRFTTSHPKGLSPEILDSMSSCPTVCEHLHLPAQSGSNNILKLMNRGYTREQYMDLAERVRSRIPGISITTDLMVGFPGESESDFEETLDLVNRVGFDSSFAFKYSPRPGTAASNLVETVSTQEKERRLDVLLKLQKRIADEKNKGLTGKILEVLPEGRAKGADGFLTGRTRSNKTVLFEGKDDEIGKPVMVEILDARGLTLYGKRQGGGNGGSPTCG